MTSYLLNQISPTRQEFERGYINSISSDLPPPVLASALQVVVSSRPPGLPKEFQPEFMARVLLVDDNDTVRNSLSFLIRSTKNVPVVTDNSNSGLIELAKGNVDLLITDGLNGECLLLCLLAKELKVRAVILSAGDYRDVADQTGAEFLTKRGSSGIDSLGEILKEIK